MDENEQQIALPYPVGEALLSWRSIARQMTEHLLKHRFTHEIIGGVIAGGVPKWNRFAIEPSHFLLQPVSPLPAQFVRVGREADDFVAEKRNEFGGRREPTQHGVDGGKCSLVERTRYAGTGVAIDNELMTGPPRNQRRDAVGWRLVRWVHQPPVRDRALQAAFRCIHPVAPPPSVSLRACRKSHAPEQRRRPGASRRETISPAHGATSSIRRRSGKRPKAKPLISWLG